MYFVGIIFEYINDMEQIKLQRKRSIKGLELHLSQSHLIRFVQLPKPREGLRLGIRSSLIWIHGLIKR